MECSYCERACNIPEGRNGFCRNYRNEQGSIRESYPDAYLNIYPVNSESIPMLHFWPNSRFLLISTIGCNFTCQGCISEFQTIREGTLETVLTRYSPEEILAIAREGDCRGISFCLNEPAVSFPTFLRVAQAAKKEGFLVGCSSNGYMTEQTLRILIPSLDYANIGLKGSSDGRYRECGAGSAEPVYRNIKALHNAGIAVEISVMYIRGREDEVIGAAQRIQAISPGIPFQLMRFVETRDELKGMGPTKEQGEQLCTDLQQYLDHVYLFNTLATRDLDSRCPACGKTIIHRVFFGPMAARIISMSPGGICTCGYRFPCRGEIEPLPEGEAEVLGGYRSMMGINILIGIAKTLGVTDEKSLDRISNAAIADNYLVHLMDHTRTIDAYLGMIRYIGRLARREERAARLTDYMQSFVAEISGRTASSEKPRVLAVIRSPLLPLFTTKFENNLVEAAGGYSLNRELDHRENATREFTAADINAINPDIILVSGHMPTGRTEFDETCRDLGITCRAIDTGRVCMLSAEPADGLPLWIPALIEVVGILHPEIFLFSPEVERARFDHAMNDGGE
jgi:pyruvate-formate lyase-activating enzyme